MTALNPKNDSPKVEATPELKQLLARLTNGHALDIVENGVVVGRLSLVPFEPPSDDAAPWEIALAVSATVPPKEWAAVPSDLAKNFEHYRYSHPKEE